MITVVFSKSLQKAVNHADRVHERDQELLTDVLDRLMAKNLEEFKTYALGEGEHGTVIPPEYDEAERPWNEPGQFLPLAGLAGGTVKVGGGDEE